MVELSPGFTAVTGETGAGKTMVVTSLGLLLGGRADPALVRIGASAVVEGRVTVRPGRPSPCGPRRRGPSWTTAPCSSAAPCPRKAARGPTSAGAPCRWGCSASCRRARRRPRPDRPAGAAEARPAARRARPVRGRGGLRAPRRVHRRLPAAAGRLRAAGGAHHPGLRERAGGRPAALRLAEIEAVAPRAGEDAELAAEAERLGHAEALVSRWRSHRALAGDPEGTLRASTRRPRGRRRPAPWRPARSHDPALAALPTARRGRRSCWLTRRGTCRVPPGDLTPTCAAWRPEERRSALNGLTRKYGEDVGAVPAGGGAPRASPGVGVGDDDRIGGLTWRRDALRAEPPSWRSARRTPVREAAARSSRTPSPRASPRSPRLTPGSPSPCGSTRVTRTGIE